MVNPKPKLAQAGRTHQEKGDGEVERTSVLLLVPSYFH